MPTGGNWINFIYVNLGFVAQVICMYYFTSMVEIKKNWPQYRCNPLYMPLSDNITDDFTYCVQNTQVNMMGYLLQPLTFIMSSISDIGGEFSTNINGVRNMLSGIRSFISSIVENVFGVFSNLVIEFQTITISIKDSVGKIIGVVVALLYILDGSVKTMNSAWNGPSGQLVKALGSCFDPSTIIELQNGKKYTIETLPLDSILKDGSKVLSVMKISNHLDEPLYKIKGIHNSILVTGTHFIFSEDKQTFIHVKDYPGAGLTNIKKDWYSCLITDSHKIPIDNLLFWDWEDDILYN